jgi:hypothetical protein
MRNNKDPDALSTETSRASSPDSKDYFFLREEIRHEDNMINQRLSWLVSSQSFLLTGFAIAVGGPAQAKSELYARLNLALVNWLPVGGVLTGLVSYVAIWAALLHTRNIRQLSGAHHPSHLPSVQGTELTRRLGSAGAVLVPMVFLATWLALISQR